MVGKRDNKDLAVIPPGKEDRVMTILERWVNGEISTDQADRELEVAGVELPNPNEGLE